MKLTVTSEEVKEMVKKHLEADLGYEIEEIEFGYGADATVKLGAKKTISYTVTAPGTYIKNPVTMPTFPPYPNTLPCSSSVQTRDAVKTVTENINKVYNYDGIDTPASKPASKKSLFDEEI